MVALRRVPRESYLSQWTYQMVWALIALGRLNEADQEIATSLERSTTDQGGVIHAARAMLRVKRGDRKGALADIEEAVARGRGFIHFHHTAYSIGAVYVQRGDFERAQQWSRKPPPPVSLLRSVRDRPVFAAPREAAVS